VNPRKDGGENRGATVERSTQVAEYGWVRSPVNRDRGASRDATPPTPPYVRVRIRRFGGLSVPQLCHGRQTQPPEASIVEGAVQRVGEAQSPRPLGAEDGLAGRPLRDIETTEFPISSATRLPLDPGDTTQTLDTLDLKEAKALLDDLAQ